MSSASKTLTVNGDITVDGTYSGGTKQLELNGANTTIDGTGTISITGENVDITTGNKTIASTAVLDITAGSLDVAAGITVTNNGSISITNNLIGTATSVWTNSNNSTLKVGGTLLTTGTLNASATGNTVEYSGTGAQTIKTPSSSTYYNLTLSGGNTKTAPASNLNITKNFTNGVTFAANGGTITFNGSTAQAIGGASTTTFNNLTVNNSLSGNALTLNSPAIVSAALTLTDGIVLTTATNKLSMGSTGTVSGFSDGSFINGPMAYNSITTATVTFPVGKDSEVHRVDLTVNGTSSNYTTEYIHSSATALGYTLPGTLERVSGIGYWTISRDAGGSVTTAAVRLYYNSNDFVSDAPNLRVAKDNGASAWVDLGGTGSGAPTGNILSTTNFTTFSAFSLANNVGGTNALPIELLSFTATPKIDVVELKWSTAMESNNDFFTVERSGDGESFDEVMILKGAGNSKGVKKYATTDHNPFPGRSYYRLKQTDFDGKYSYSDVISVQMVEGASWRVFPNPNDGNIINLKLTKNESGKEVQIIIHDLNGKSFLQTYSTPDDRSIISLSLPQKLTNGVYIISIQSGLKIQQQKLIVFY